jgi:hypothetical protein
VPGSGSPGGDSGHRSDDGPDDQGVIGPSERGFNPPSHCHFLLLCASAVVAWSMARIRPASYGECGGANRNLGSRWPWTVQCHVIFTFDPLEPTTRSWGSRVTVHHPFGHPPFDPVLGVFRCRLSSYGVELKGMVTRGGIVGAGRFLLPPGLPCHPSMGWQGLGE